MADASFSNGVLMTSLLQLLSQAPVLLALAAGVVVFLAVIRISAAVRALSAISFALLLAGRVAQVFVTNALVMQRAQAGWTVAEMARYLGVASIAFSLLEAAALGLLIGAVLIGRAGSVSRSAGERA